MLGFIWRFILIVLTPIVGLYLAEIMTTVPLTPFILRISERDFYDWQYEYGSLSFLVFALVGIIGIVAWGFDRINQYEQLMDRVRNIDRSRNK